MPRPPDAIGSRDRRRALALLAALAVLVKLPTLGTPAFWDEMAFVEQAGWLADNGLLRVLPGLRPDALFFGHPPGLHFAAAVLFKLFGRTIEVAHVLIACVGAIGIGATYSLVRAADDESTAWLAALLLLFSPAWFASAGMFLADLPVAALGVLSAGFIMRSRLVPFFVAASCMVLIKETAVSLVVVLVAFRLLTRRPLTRATLKDALPYATPLLVFAAFVLVQKVATGKFFYIYDFETDPLLDVSIGSALRQASAISHWIFIAQFRWLLTAAIALDLATSRDARHRPLLLLFGLVTVASGFAFSVIYYVPRYVLPVLPFFYAIGAMSLMSLARTAIRQRVASAVVLGLTLWSLARKPVRGHHGDNLYYLGIVRLHLAAAREVEARYAGARIVSAWPAAAQLRNPLLGYVSTPLRVKWFTAPADLAESDVAVVARPGNDTAERLEALASSSGWSLASRQEFGIDVVTVYERRASTRPAGAESAPDASTPPTGFRLGDVK